MRAPAAGPTMRAREGRPASENNVRTIQKRQGSSQSQRHSAEKKLLVRHTHAPAAVDLRAAGLPINRGKRESEKKEARGLEERQPPDMRVTSNLTE
jgi:hypothetical protein